MYYCSVSALIQRFSCNHQLLLELAGLKLCVEAILITDNKCVSFSSDLLVLILFHEWQLLFTQICATKYHTHLASKLNDFQGSTCRWAGIKSWHPASNNLFFQNWAMLQFYLLHLFYHCLLYQHQHLLIHWRQQLSHPGVSKLEIKLQIWLPRNQYFLHGN